MQESEELKTLRVLQKRTNRYLSQDEFTRIDYLQSKLYDRHCMNPRCEGGAFPDHETCPDCGCLLHIHRE
jgi:hypothetical protein